MSLKPLVRWTTFQGWTLRYSERTDERAAGIFTTPAGAIPFRYDQDARVIHLPDRAVQLNEHGWEVDSKGQTRFHSKRDKGVSDDDA